MSNKLAYPCQFAKCQATELAALLERYINAYPAFRMKPCGSPGSQVRDEQERLMALEDSARAAIAKARGEK